MKLSALELNLSDFPQSLHSFVKDASLFDSSSSPEARVFYSDKDCGYFIKKAPLGSLFREAEMTRFFEKRKLSAEVLAYISDSCDYLVTKKIKGNDCLAPQYLADPVRLTDTLAEALLLIHSQSTKDCPVDNHTLLYNARARENFLSGAFDKTHFPDSFGYACAEDAIRVVEDYGHLLKADTLLHGDFCLPNIILDNWKLSGFIDVGSGGIGDRHVDIFWAVWTLSYNLKTNIFRDRFLDAYGRTNIDEEMLDVVAAFEVFG